MEKILNDSVAISNDSERIATEERLLKFLGFLNLDDSYIEFLERYFRGSVGGFYSPRRKQLIANATMEGERGEEILAHEMTHALQDQHFGLLRITSEHVTTDCSLARLAIVEGDANWVMKTVKGREACPGDIIPGINLALHREEFGETKPRHPALLRLFSFPYRYGTQFVCEIVRGSGVAVLNRLVESPPTATAQILAISADTPGESRCAPMNHADSSDSIGVFGIFSLLSGWLPLEEAKAAAEGLSADVLSWTDRGMEWNLRWQTADEAQEFSTFFRKSQRIRFDLDHAGAESDGAVVIHGEDLLVTLVTRANLVTVSYSLNEVAS